MDKRVEFGVFMPVGRGGWIRSTTAPPVPATYAYNRQVAILAEEMGIDFLLAMAKWRGFGGSSDHWNETLESMTTVAALAEVTNRVKIMPTVHTLAFNVATVAKMMATLDQISNGRMGLNIVSGWYTKELEQMGLWPDGITHDERYEVAREWVHAIKRLWAEERVTFDGKYIKLEDCMSYPKPLQEHPTIVCAGTSDVGMKFTVDEADIAFMGLSWEEDQGTHLSRRAKQFAREAGKETKTYALCMVVPGKTDEEAQARVALYDSGVDMIAKQVSLPDTLKEIARTPDGGMAESPMTKRRLAEAARPNALGPGAIVGSPDTIVRKFEEVVAAADWDGFLLTFPDFIGDLEFFGREILPRLRPDVLALQSAPEGVAAN